MSGKRREWLAILLVIILVFLSFGAGYLANEVIRTKILGGSAETLDEQFSVFWEAWDKIDENYIGHLPTYEEITYGAAHGSIRALDDPYTVFVEPVDRELERDRLRGNFGGVGVELTRTEDGIFIMEPIPGNPAEAAGILSGDQLLAVDGVELTTNTTVQEVAEMVRGEEGTEVILTVMHQGEDAPVDIPVERSTILIPSVSYKILEQDEAIGYIRITRFTGESGEEIEDAILSLVGDGAQRLIVDLRQNGGGLRDAAVDVSNHFLDGGVVVYQQNRAGEEQEFKASKGELVPDIPLVVLIDEGTASAAEIVAGAIQDRERGALIGMPSFGKGSVQLVFDLSDGSSVHVTSARWLTPNRNQLDVEGLQPDIRVEISQDALDSGIDEVLERAVFYYQNGQ